MSRKDFRMFTALFLVIALLGTAEAHVKQSALRANKEELRRVQKICKANRIERVLVEHVYKLEQDGAPSPRFLVPTRNKWLDPNTLELQLISDKEVVTGLASPLWRHESYLRFDSLESIDFRDLNGDERLDFTVVGSGRDSSEMNHRFFVSFYADPKGGFRLDERASLAGAGLMTLDQYFKGLGRSAASPSF